MSDRERVEESLRQSEGLLRAVVQTAVDGIITIDERGTVMTVNPAVERIFGYPAEEIIGRNVNMLMPEPYRSEHDTYLENYQRTGQAKIIGIGREVEGLRRDGRRFPLYLGVSETQVGPRRIFTGIVRDMSQQKAAEQALARQARELERRAKELARSNAELESFAAMVSHDLRAPLVTMAGYAQLLEEQARHKLEPEELELIQYVRDSVQQMAGLIQSLLGYARVGSAGLRLEPCDCERVLEKVLQGLEAVLHATQAEVTHDPLPTLPADEALLLVLFQNLIENGIKYHGDRPPRVRVAARLEAGEWVFSVRDNGIGIDPRNFDRVFEPFQRLHHDESRYQGMGIGLATCQKIVERHGGRIWVESQAGQGAAFFFTIPG